MTVKATAPKTDDLATLMIELLRSAYPQITQAEIHDGRGDFLASPPTLPAIRVRTTREVIDPHRAHVHGDVSVAVFTDHWHRLQVDRRQFTTGTGSVLGDMVKQPSGDIRKVYNGGTPKRSVLADGTVATVIPLRLSNVIPRVPVVPLGQPASHVLSVFGQILAGEVERPWMSVPLKVKAFASQVACSERQGDEGEVTRVLTTSVTTHYFDGTRRDDAEMKTLSTIDNMQDRAFNSLGRVTRVFVDRIEYGTGFVRVAARFEVASKIPGKASRSQAA